MQAGFQRLVEYLDRAGVTYHVIHHPVDYRSEATAGHTGTPPAEFAKTVFVWIDGDPAMVVRPASRDVALGRLRRSLGAEEVRVARESELSELCPDCEVGAAPPFGNLYDLDVYVSRSLAQDEEITCNGGTHENAIRIAFADFERLVKPRILALARHD
jgi:Ala-tRNA(Pro) deacylase